MKKFYLLFLSMLFSASDLFCQCVANIQIASDGKGVYTFTATAPGDTSAYSEYHWQLFSDTNLLFEDSAVLQTAFTFDTNGTYTIHYTMVDTFTLCSIDTTISFHVADAEYLPLLDSVNRWHLFNNLCPVRPEPTNNNSRANDCWYGNFGFQASYYTNSDTSINLLSYQKVFLGNTWSGCFFGFLREDVQERKIYFMDNLGNQEVLLYDFSMKPGDSIYIRFHQNFSFDFRGGNYRLDSVKMFPTKMGDARMFYLNNLDSVSGTLIWNEGIGSIADPFYLYSPYFGQIGGCFINSNCEAPQSWPILYPHIMARFVTCYQHSASVYFDSCAYSQVVNNWCIMMEDSCYYYNTCGAIEKLSSVSSFVVSPNPATDRVTVNMDVKRSDEFRIVLFDLQGRAVLAEKNLGVLREGKHTYTLPLPNLNSGLYLIGCKTTEGTLLEKLVVY